jgi:hypothetical protein
MPKLPRSGTKGLVKQHKDGCSNRTGDLTKCPCPWWGKYRSAYVSLAKWSGQTVDPDSKKHAKTVLGRLVAAVDGRVFLDPARVVASTEQPKRPRRGRLGPGRRHLSTGRKAGH